MRIQKCLQKSPQITCEKQAGWKKFSVMDAVTEVLQNNHLNFTDSPSMMGSDTYVVNVGIKQLQKKFLKPILWQLSMVKTHVANNPGPKC